MFDSIESVSETLGRFSYVADPGLATSLFLGLRMERPLFLEGEPGVGKTEIAKVLASALATPLIRLQCYEGLDVNHAVYEWNYPRQLLEIQSRRDGEGPTTDDIFWCRRKRRDTSRNRGRRSNGPSAFRAEGTGRCSSTWAPCGG